MIIIGRKRRNWHPDGIFHIGMRGNNRQNIFLDARDVEKYYEILDYAHGKYPYDMYAYCIMTNHVHLLLKSPNAELGKLMAIINKRYSDYFRKRYSYTGQIYENRYFSKEVPHPVSLLFTSAYIHRNPIETKVPIVPSLELYPYSSYPYYFCAKPSPHPYLNLHLLPALLPTKDKSPQAYALFCEQWVPGTKVPGT